MADVEAQIHSVPEHQPASATANAESHCAAPRLTSTTANPQTTNHSTHPRPPIAVIPLSRANDRPHVNLPPSQIPGNQGEKYGDSSDAVWSMYLTEAEKQDKDVIESWKGDTDGILVFTGLFSATVATFIIESYQNLSPNRSDTTNALLGQITQQLVNISTGTPLTIVVAQDNQPFKPTASTVRVNVLWFSSLVLSLTCALSATLMQQWARRYREFAQSHGAPHRRGRIRAYIFDGIRKFGMARAVATMPLLLHISVFLFLVGLVEFLFPIDATVSYSTLALVVAIALAYAMITISPNLYLNCPYATPLSGVTWRLSQLFVIVGLKATLGIEALFHNPIFKLWSRLSRHVAELSIESWMKALKDKVEAHRHRLSEGLRKSIKRNANEASPMVVPSALEWTLTTLDEDKEIEKFATGVLGLFDSHTIPDATILSLMAIKPLTDAIFGFRLYDLLKTCLLGTSPLNDEDRKSRLRVCLKCLWYFGRAYNKLQVPELLPSYFPLSVVSPEIIQCIQTEPDPLSRVMGHCFGALIVTKLAADVRSRTNSNIPLEVSEDELACLSTFFNADRREVIFCLECPGAIELASMVSLASGAVDPLRNDNGTLDVLPLSQETLNILSGMAEPHLDKPNAQLSISNGKFDRIIVLPLLNLLQTYIMISGTSGLAADLRMGCLRMCLKSLWYCAKAYHQSGASKPLPSYFPITLSSLEIIHRIRVEEDLTSRVMGCCVRALVVMKLAADARSHPDSNIQIGDDELACLSTILGTKRDDVKFCLERPGAIELASMVSLALGDLGSLDVSTLPPDVFDVVHQTLTILSRSLPAGETARPQLDRPLSQLNILNGAFDRAVVSRLLQVLNACFMISSPSPLTTETRRSCLRMCLMSLWYCAKAYHQLGHSKVLPAYFFLEFATPEIIRHIQTEKDPVSYVIGRCFQALIVSKGAAYIKLCTDSDVQLHDKVLTCLSAILGTECDSLRLWLEQPGAMELLNVVFLAFEDIKSSATDTVPSYVLDVIPQTFRILSQAFPVEMNIELQLEAHADIPDVGTAPVTGEIFRNHSIRCLKNLWYHLRAFSQPENSVPLPSYILFAFASPALAHRICTAGGLATGVIGRCIEALVIEELLTGVKPSSNSSSQIRNNKLAWLSVILGTESDDVKFCLECPGAVELATMVSLAFGDVGPAISELPSDVGDVAQQTLAVLSQAAELHLDQPISQLDISDAKFDRVIVSGFHKLLQMCKIDASPLPAEVRRSCLRMFLKSLWYCAQAYHRPGTSKPLPSYFPSTLASPKIADLIRDEEDPVSHFVGRCFIALVVMKLAVDVRLRQGSRANSDVQVNDDALLCLAGAFDEKGPYLLERHRNWALSGRLNLPGTIELLNIVFLACEDVNKFLTADTDWVPSYALNAIRQTFSILSRALPAEINTELELDQMCLQAKVSSDRSAPIMGQIYRNHSIECLKNLWCRLQVYHQPGNSEPLPSYVLIAFNDPILVNCLSGARDVATSMMGRCVRALLIKEPVAGVKPITHSYAQTLVDKHLVASYSAILDIHQGDVKLFLECPGTVGLASMVVIVSGGVSSSDFNALPSDVRDVAQQTLAILSRTANLHLDQPIAQLDISDARVDRIIVSGFRNLLQKCILGASTLTTNVRRGCLRISLKCLWYYAKTYQQLDASEPSSAYFFSTLGIASPEFIHLLQTEQDHDSRVMGRCMCALAVMKLTAEVRSRSDPCVQIGDDELACLSTILGTRSDDVKYCLEWPGAVELATIASLGLGDYASLAFSLKSFGDLKLYEEASRVASEILAIISQALPAENAVGLQPFTRDDVFSGELVFVVVSCLHNFLRVSISGTSALTANVRRSCLRMCLRSLWYCAKAYHQPFSEPLPSYFPSTLASPEIIRLIDVEQDPVSRATGRCFGALAVTKLAADIRSPKYPNTKISDDELRVRLTCLSTILGTKNGDVRICLKRPGVIELACMVSIALGDVGSLDVDALPSDVRDVAQQTLAILSQTAELQLDLPIAQLNCLDGEFDRVIVSGLHDLLHESISGTSRASAFTAEVRRSCLRMSLNCLWYCAKAYHQPGASKPLPSYFPSTLASPEIIRLIQVEQDPVSRVTGRCFGALVVMKLVADIRSRADLNLPISDEELACLSAILGAESHDMKIWLSRPCAVELANILLLLSSEIGFLFSDTAWSEGLDMMQQTYGILTRTLPEELNAKLTNFTAGTSPLTGTEPIHERQLRTCQENLWHCARAYNQLGTAVPLPSFVRITLTGPGFTGRIHAERDLTTRVTGRCVQALIVNTLADSFLSLISSGDDGVYDEELRRVSSFLDTEPSELSRWPRPSAVIKLQNVVSLMSGEIEALFTSGTPPANVLQIVQQTLDIICSDLVLRGVFDGGDLLMDQVLPLREICSRIANARPANRFRDEMVGILERLEQISKQLPTVERKMRRCTSSVFEPQFVRGRSNLTSRPEESRRRSKSM